MSVRRAMVPGGIVGVQGAEQFMPCQGRLDGDISGFFVANFSHQNNVRILPQEGPQGIGESDPDFSVHLHLNNAWQGIFDRVFSSADAQFRTVDLIEGGI